ncbi:MAG: M20/M25/M40 family metallo-hydrolase [candidate division NC10 bacterium]|nr:M20/M25/M40 family metallo-hydrolase [candidate division NC10 bacterium]
MTSELLGCIDADRLQHLTLDLVRIRSYTGDTREVAAFYARHLEQIGLEVEVLRDFPNAPCVVARLRGVGGGPTLELNGHLDTVPVDHPAPYVADGRVYGRGAADMKGGLAAMAEAAEVIAESGRRLKGDVLLVAHGLHEAPDGHGEDIRELVRRGVKGDAVIITEISADVLPVVGLGLSIFDATVRRPGDASHELLTPPGTPHPIRGAVSLVNLMEVRHAELARNPLPYVGAESYFLGTLHGGDFFNRWTNACRVVGTRRYGPDTAFADVEAELREMVGRVEAETGCSVDLALTRVRDGFRVAETEPIVVALREAYRAVAGRELPLVGSRMVGDAPIFIQEGGVPAVYHGPGGTGAHADLESVPIAELVRAAKVYVLTTLSYVGCESR